MKLTDPIKASPAVAKFVLNSLIIGFVGAVIVILTMQGSVSSANLAREKAESDAKILQAREDGLSRQVGDLVKEVDTLKKAALTHQKREEGLEEQLKRARQEIQTLKSQPKAAVKPAVPPSTPAAAERTPVEEDGPIGRTQAVILCHEEINRQAGEIVQWTGGLMYEMENQPKYWPQVGYLKWYPMVKTSMGKFKFECIVHNSGEVEATRIRQVG